MIFVQRYVFFFLLLSSSQNPKVEVVRKLASDCPHLKCCFAGVLFSATSQIPYYLHQFLDVSVLRKIIPWACLSEVKEPSLVEIDLMVVCLKALRWCLLFGSSVGRNVALVTIPPTKPMCLSFLFPYPYKPRNVSYSFATNHLPIASLPFTSLSRVEGLTVSETVGYWLFSYFFCWEEDSLLRLSRSLENEPVFVSIAFYSFTDLCLIL